MGVRVKHLTSCSNIVPATSGLHWTPISALGFALASPIMRKTNHQAVRRLAKRYNTKGSSK